MKIAFFIGSMERGGAERVISILANHYAAKGWMVELVLLLDNVVKYELDERIKIVDLSGKHGSYMKNAPGWLFGIRRYLKQAKPDKIVSFIGRINALVLTATAGMRVKIVASERNDPKQDGRGGLILSLCNAGYKSRRCKAIVYQNKHQEACFSSALLKKSFVIPNPIEVKAERKENEAYRIVTAGRLAVQKNQSLLIDAVASLADEFPQLVTDIYGDGPLEEALREKIAEKGVQQRVFLRGNVSDLHSQIASAGIFVMTSEFEGLSNALLEAMMMGIPCISTDYPGVEEVITDGVNGLLVPRGDQDALVTAIRRVLTDAELSRRLSEGAKKTSVAYERGTVLKLWESVIEA